MWIVGLGQAETSSSWTDVDYGLRNANGQLQVYESGQWRATSPRRLVRGDVLSLHVSGGVIEYWVNNRLLYTRATRPARTLYVDTAFREGAAALAVTLTRDLP